MSKSYIPKKCIFLSINKLHSLQILQDDENDDDNVEMLNPTLDNLQNPDDENESTLLLKQRPLSQHGKRFHHVFI